MRSRTERIVERTAGRNTHLFVLRRLKVSRFSTPTLKQAFPPSDPLLSSCISDSVEKHLDAALDAGEVVHALRRCRSVV